MVQKSNYDFLGNEKDLENNIIENIIDISKNIGWPDIKRFKKQAVLKTSVSGKNKFIIDVLLIHVDGTLTVIECKLCKDSKQNTVGIGQLLKYGTIFNNFDGKKPRLVLAIPKFSHDLIEIIETYNLPISLLVIDFDRFLYFNNTDHGE